MLRPLHQTRKTIKLAKNVVQNVNTNSILPFFIPPFLHCRKHVHELLISVLNYTKNIFKNKDLICRLMVPMIWVSCSFGGLICKFTEFKWALSVKCRRIHKVNRSNKWWSQFQFEAIDLKRFTNGFNLFDPIEPIASFYL